MTSDLGVVGELLPLALGVAISPVPIIAVILMLLAPRAGGTSLGFLIGWVAGIVIATVLFAVIASTAGLSSGSEPSAVLSWIKLLLGVLMLLLAVKQWRSRPAPGREAELPGWMKAIDQVTPVKGAALGFLLSAVNPKNLMMCAAAGIAVAQGGSYVVPIVVFTLVAACTVAVPVIGYAVAAERMRGPLDRLRGWLALARKWTRMNLLERARDPNSAEDKARLGKLVERFSDLAREILGDIP